MEKNLYLLIFKLHWSFSILNLNNFCVFILFKSHTVFVPGDCNGLAFVRKSIGMVQLTSNFTCFLLISDKNFNLDLLLLALDLADNTDLGAFLWESQPSCVGSGTEKIFFYYVSILMTFVLKKFSTKENSEYL